MQTLCRLYAEICRLKSDMVQTIIHVCTFCANLCRLKLHWIHTWCMVVIQLSLPAWWASKRRSFSPFDTQVPSQCTFSFKYYKLFYFWQLLWELAWQLHGSGSGSHLPRQSKTAAGLVIIQCRLPMTAKSNPNRILVWSTATADEETKRSRTKSANLWLRLSALALQASSNYCAI